MIKNITLKFGRAPGISAEAISTTPITIFVGPNNSGKSKVLQELHRYCISGRKNLTDVILEHIEFEQFSPEETEQRIQRVTLAPIYGEALQPDHVIVGKKGNRIQVPQNVLREALKNTNANIQHFCQWYLTYNTLMLDGRSRIDLINEQPAGDLQRSAHTSFQMLFRDNTQRGKVRSIINDAFGLFFAIDPTKLGHLRLRLAPRAPESEIEERGIHEAAVKYMQMLYLLNRLVSCQLNNFTDLSFRAKRGIS